MHSYTETTWIFNLLKIKTEVNQINKQINSKYQREGNKKAMKNKKGFPLEFCI